jgi:acyl carrier protein
MNAVSAETIQHWLVTHLAEELGLEPQDMDVHMPLSEYGLDSLVGMTLAGDLAEWLGLQLSPTLLWDYPVIASLAQHLADALTSANAEPMRLANPVNVSGSVVALENTAHLLAQLDTLSDAEVDSFLHELAAA